MEGETQNGKKRIVFFQNVKFWIVRKNLKSTSWRFVVEATVTHNYVNKVIGVHLEALKM